MGNWNVTAELSLDRQKGLFCPKQNRLAFCKVKDNIYKPFSSNTTLKELSEAGP